MNWETFYLICFLVGLLLSALSLLGGTGHIGSHAGVHLGGHFGGHVHLPHAAQLPHAGAALRGAARAAGGARGSTAAAVTVPWWNAFSLMIFLCWFGASGYLLTRFGALIAGVVLLLACVCGFIGGAIVFLFLAKVLLPHEREISADETAVVGVVGRVSSAIRPGGTGEIVYEQLGARRSTPARAEDGDPIQKLEEVFVVRYEKGIAYVRRWEEEEGLGARD